MAAGGLVAFALSRRCCYYWRSLGDSKPCFLNKVSPLLTDRCLLFVYYPRWRQRNIFVDCRPYRAGENNHNHCIAPLEITALGQSLPEIPGRCIDDDANATNLRRPLLGA